MLLFFIMVFFFGKCVFSWIGRWLVFIFAAVFICFYLLFICYEKKFYVTPRLVLSALVSGSLLTGSNEVSGVGGNSGVGYGGASSGGARTRGRSWAEED